VRASLYFTSIYYCLSDALMNRNCEGFIIVYSITDARSFSHLDKCYGEIPLDKLGRTPPLVLVGTRCDREDARQVSMSSGRDKAKEWNCPFFEVSAKTSENVHETFDAVVRAVRSSRKEQEPVAVTKVDRQRKKTRRTWLCM
jgi:GTPase KRas protein